MKYQKSLIVGTLVALVSITGVTVAATHSNPPRYTEPLKTATVETTPTVTQEAQPVDTTPTVSAAPVASSAQTTPTTPQTSVEWWQSFKATHGDDEAGCLVSLMSTRSKSMTDTTILQSESDYAINTYGSVCLGLAYLSHANPDHPY